MFKAVWWRNARPLAYLRFAFLCLAVWQWSSAAWIFAKAQLAQWLLANAWGETLQTHHSPVKPWPWADTWPVARLQVPAQKVNLFVLAGAQGNSLAFGPGHLHGTAAPGEGFSVIGGHRDTHFGFLQHLLVGDELLVQTPAGVVLRYRVQSTEIVDSRSQPLRIEPERRGLVLITCFPFDAMDTSGPLRYLVWADEIASVTYSM